jgi:hypothetical protein
VKRAAFLLFFVGAPLALLLYPRLRRALARKARLVLLVYAGALLATAAFSSRAAPIPPLAWIGMALLLGAFIAVLRDVTRPA